jgi:hypothetical protein
MTGIFFAMLVLRPGNTVHRAGFYGLLDFIRIGAARVYDQSKPQRLVQSKDLGANLLAGSAADAGFLINHGYFFSQAVLLCRIFRENELRAFADHSFLFHPRQGDGIFNYILTSRKMKIRSFHTGQECLTEDH